MTGVVADYLVVHQAMIHAAQGAIKLARGLGLDDIDLVIRNGAEGKPGLTIVLTIPSFELEEP